MPYGSLPIRVGKQFTKSRKFGKAHQHILVFVNGNAKESGVFDSRDPEQAEKDIDGYQKQTAGMLGNKHKKVLVFTNGDPVKASEDIGVPETKEEMTEEEYLLDGPKYG
jgi:hypothetical protein